MKQIFKIIFPIFIFLVGIAGFFVLKATVPKSLPQTAKEKVWLVATKRLKVLDIRPEIFEFGTVVCANEADLRPLVSGRIIDIGANYSEGAVIKAGESLFVIDPFDYQIQVEDSQARLAEVLAKIKGATLDIKSEKHLLSISKSQFTLRKRDFERRKNLGKKGSSSKKATDDAEISFNEASRAVTAYQQSILRLRTSLAEEKSKELLVRSALKRAKRDLLETKLVAPFDGFLAQAGASVGQYVDSTSQLSRLIDVSRLEVRFRLTERDFSSLLGDAMIDKKRGNHFNELLGKTVRIRWEVGSQNFNYNAIIDRIGAKIEPTSGGVNIYARLLGIDLDTPLRPGAFVEVTIPDRLYKKVVRVPETAIVGGKIMYIVNDGFLVAKKIDIIRRTGDSILVRGDFLDGEVIVTQTFPEIGSGLRIETQ